MRRPELTEPNEREVMPPATSRTNARLEFWTLFTEKTGYEHLDERKRLTAAKAQQLLVVLEHPELPLHNNPAELAARTMVNTARLRKNRG